MRVVVIGATGAVGLSIIEILEDRKFPVDELVLVASSRSVGRKLPFKNSFVEVMALEPGVFVDADIAFFDVPDELASQWAPIATAAGATVVDNSAAWRMDPDVPLVVPEVNPQATTERRKGIIASPNCTTLAMVVPTAALHARAGLSRLVLASYQSASGAGRLGIEDLWSQTLEATQWADRVTDGLGREVLDGGKAFAQPIAMNVIPSCGSTKEDGYTSEELKLGHETRKIMSLPDLKVTATCVRVPVMVGHGVAVHAEFERPITPDEARETFRNAPGVELQDDPDADLYPTALQAAGRDPCFVGRVRQDLHDSNALAYFCVADNLRKGAALNTVQIAELLVQEKRNVVS